ncbi:hypothetical protein [Dokdonella soli]|uniref:Uncharacterized protein n=1 Tax=Dokdonella soli TaxID=529810 RepID=A0ABP3TIK9_9GAMM
MNRIILSLLVLLSLTACQNALHAGATRSVAGAPTMADGMLVGEFDNHEQVWTARENAAAIAPAHVVVTLEPTSHADWTLWRIHLDATPAMDAVWAMQQVAGANGATALLPHRALLAAPAMGAAFDAQQWAPLDACALRGTIAGTGIKVAGDPASCAAIVPGIGPQAPLLPIAVEREGEWLRLRLYADQARGTEAREDARRIVFFGGWAAVNGAGPTAAADSKDWHMDRSVRLGSEGGRAALKWRDGSASGYSLGLERLTYRDGNVPVLKLSVIDDRNGGTLAYAWANPEAQRIGINLGWVQIGLQRETEAGAARR